MENIDVKMLNKDEGVWNFLVIVGERNDLIQYSVSLLEDYWWKLTNGKISPEELVEKSFSFLLANEPKESILKKFDLSVISIYFPEYESKIKVI